MSSTWRNYLSNLGRLAQGKTILAPLVVSYCVTTQCNLNCCYCEDFGARRNAAQPAPLELAQARQVLAIIRQATDSLVFTGGEPLLYPGLAELARYARELRFGSVSMISNGTLLPQAAAVLDCLDRLIISLDSVDTPAWDATLRGESGAAARILENITAVARERRPHQLQVVAHCVITPATLSQAGAVLEFCAQRNILFSFSPQAVNNWPHYDLLTAQPYRNFVAQVSEYKLHGAAILGSWPYLDMMATFAPYACYPMLAPRIMPDGTLSFPCRPIERSGNAHGGRAINVLTAGSWAVAVAQATALYGDPPVLCGSCYQQCYVEPSLLQAQPWALAREWLNFAPSRRAKILTYVPG